MKPLLPASAILALLTAPPLLSGAPDDSGLAARLLRELEQVRQQQQQGVQTHYAKTMSDLNAAAASGVTAVDVYEESIKAIDFEGKKRDAAEFQAWKKDNAEKVRNRTFEEAARLHFQWLVFTIKHVRGATVESMADDIRRHCTEVNNLLDGIKDGEKPDLSLLQSSVRSGKIVQYLNLERIVNPPGAGKDTGWADVAGDVDAIMSATLLPIYREKLDRRLITYWDDRITRVERRAEKVQLASKQDKILTEQLPTLRWNRSKDVLLLGDRRTALESMMTLIKSHPMHPQFEGWCRELKTELESAASAPAEPAVTPAPASAPAASAPAPAPAARPGGSTYFGNPTPPRPAAAPAAPVAPAPAAAPARDLSGREAELQGETQ